MLMPFNDSGIVTIWKGGYIPGPLLIISRADMNCQVPYWLYKSHTVRSAGLSASALVIKNLGNRVLVLTKFTRKTHCRVSAAIGRSVRVGIMWAA